MDWAYSILGDIAALVTMMPGKALGGPYATMELPQADLERLTPRMLNLQSLVKPMLMRSWQDRE
jgi:hypothetical protein